jgi:hypothetical protein
MLKRVFFCSLIATWVVIGGFGTDTAPAAWAPAAVPLPSTLPLLGLGLALLGASRRRSK